MMTKRRNLEAAGREKQRRRTELDLTSYEVLTEILNRA